MEHSLDPMLRPQSVAIIGASDAIERIGGRPIHSMKNGNYQGRIYAVNPKRDTIQGLPAYASIGDVPEVVDCAIIAIPAQSVIATLKDCAAQGVKSAVIFSSGFAEMGEAGVETEAEIRAIAQRSGMRVIGPNCLGVFNLTESWFGTFANAPSLITLPPGPVGLVSQSGAYGSHLVVAAQRRGVGVNYWVTTGNECDVDVAEVIEYYAQAPDVRVIVAYAEGIKNAGRICRALAMARDARKPVIFVKVGKSDVGSQAAASHTASLAGADAIYDALFRQYGVYRAETTEEMVDVAYACQFGRYPAARKISLQTISGGVGVQLADAADKYRLDVAPLPEKTQKKLKELIPFAAVRNPVDFTGQALNQPHLMQANVSLTIDEADYDSHIIYVSSVPGSAYTRESCLEIFSNLRRDYPDEVMMLSMLAPEEVVRQYEALGYPCFEDPSLAVRAMAALTHFGEVFKRGQPQLPAALPAGVMPPPTTDVSEYEAKKVLASIGIPVTREALAGGAEDAVRIWQDIGGPVVMKIASPDILHKTEIGGVLLHINNKESVAEAYITLIERARTAKPDARIDGVIVAEMVSGGVETVLGVARDPVFGPVVMFGLGGVFVEVLKDVTFRLAPFGVDEARRMIDEIQGRAMLDGVRGAEPADIGALAETLSRLSVYADDNAQRIESIDLNPFLVMPDGAVAVDALIVPRQGRIASHNNNL